MTPIRRCEIIPVVISWYHCAIFYADNFFQTFNNVLHFFLTTPMNGIGCYPLLTVVTVESVQCYI